MGYFVIIVFTTFLGSPPEFLPVAFKSNSDCLNYLTKKVVKNSLAITRANQLEIKNYKKRKK